MLRSEHIETAERCLGDADLDYETGDVLQASEKLWGAASHVVLAEMLRRGMKPSGHKSTVDAVEMLGDDWEDPRLRALFTSAEMLHANFYHGFLEDQRFFEQRELTREFVERVLEHSQADS